MLDGTLSSLIPGQETNAGLAYKLLRESVPNTSVYYEAGVQWDGMRSLMKVMTGHGLDEQIERAYGFLASRYREGDKIVLIGYSRGAYAVRSLAGLLDAIGLLRRDATNVRNVRTAFRHYQNNPYGPYAIQFRLQNCHETVPIEMVCVWDTVKALGIRLPVLWQIAEFNHGFHSHHLGISVKHGFQALALEETRSVYEPVLWECPPNWPAHIEQVWFRGSHGDVGAQLMGNRKSRPLSNIPLVWMLSRMEKHGIDLPRGWRTRFPQDPSAPSVGTWHRWGPLFLLRSRRNPGRDRTESVHASAAHLAPGLPVVDQDYLSVARNPRADKGGDTGPG